MYPSGEEYDAVNNRLVIADTGRDRVLIYSLTGTRLSTFGSYGTGNGQFASPRDIAVDDVGNIYVADAENNRIQAFTATGTFRWKAGGLQQGADTLNTPIGLTWDSVERRTARRLDRPVADQGVQRGRRCGCGTHRPVTRSAPTPPAT